MSLDLQIIKLLFIGRWLFSIQLNSMRLYWHKKQTFTMSKQVWNYSKISRLKNRSSVNNSYWLWKPISTIRFFYERLGPAWTYNLLIESVVFLSALFSLKQVGLSCLKNDVCVSTRTQQHWQSDDTNLIKLHSRCSHWNWSAELLSVNTEESWWCYYFFKI